MNALRDTFEHQAIACETLGSPFMGQLCRVLHAQHLSGNETPGAIYPPNTVSDADLWAAVNRTLQNHADGCGAVLARSPCQAPRNHTRTATMKTFLKWLGLGLVMGIAMVVILGLWEREKLARLLAVNSLFAEDRIVANFSAMDTLFEHIAVPNDPNVTNTLTSGPPMDMPAGVERPRGLVIAVNGAGRNLREDGASDSNIAMFRAIAESLD